MQKKRITSALPSVPYPRHVEPIDDLMTGGFQLFLSPRSGLIGETRVLESSSVVALTSPVRYIAAFST
jgi:hypothetical protein